MPQPIYNYYLYIEFCTTFWTTKMFFFTCFRITKTIDKQKGDTIETVKC